jgi:cellulose synthase/poly-beta-1,6-N-acetylglucosamine synthase-like glycosyltransferase
MMEVLLIIYFLLILFILCYSLVQANLIFHYIFNRKKRKEPLHPLTSFPHVTVQLPIYNELYVVERLIDTVCSIHYPNEKLEIQVLDDSDDETVQLIAAKVLEWKSKGIDIIHVKRPERTGFKAGALEFGLTMAKGEFIAIFDADFVPERDFLINTVPFFEDSKVGMVQTRWGHLNKHHSMLTRLQAFGLDGHFVVEQAGRNSGGYFMNFNGTGGIWRKQCILDSGGWHYDTLTEDLELSYRAQMKGWRFRYLENRISPAELPPVMTALKSQQYRWTKGAAETARKHFGTVFLHKKLSFRVKVHASFHLLNSALFLCILGSALLSLPLLAFGDSLILYQDFYKYGILFLISLLILSVTYWIGYSKSEKNKIKAFKRFLVDLPLFLSVSMGLSLHNTVAVLEGYFGKKTPFIRTPKFNLNVDKKGWKQNQYLTKSLNFLTIAEGFLSLYFFSGVVLAFIKENFAVLPFHLMLTFGFGIVFYYSVFHSFQSKTKGSFS